MKKKTMQETLYENKLKMQEQKRQEILRNKREYRKECILATFIGLAIVVGTFTILFFQNRDYGQAVNYCLNQGHSENYCYRNL